MGFWFEEYHTANTKFGIRVGEQLYHGESEYQKIDVFDSPEFGRVLTSNGSVIFTDQEEFVYDEMVVHVPMAVHPNVKRVLVLGGGDGGVARELAHYNEIEIIDVVEPDKMFVDVSRKFFPNNAVGLDDVRVRIHYEDGLRFLRKCSDQYDLIINDATDPLGHEAGLFTKEFYGNCYKALHADGIMVNQHESPFYTQDAYAMQRAHKRIVSSFPISRVYQAHIPTYPSGHWLFGFAAKKRHPVKDVDFAHWNALGLKTRYYNTQLHAGAFALPNYVEEMLRDVEP